jgi:hypothetical protein
MRVTAARSNAGNDKAARAGVVNGDATAPDPAAIARRRRGDPAALRWTYV